ncbi:MAG: hypothetical protein KDC24_13395 [Saprospiraceae bacterium]|nr:hypothetical protein [Saprospiraceae bacterium]
MELKELLRKLDQTILFADFEKALDNFFSKKVKTIYKDNLIDGLPYKMRLLQSFLLEVEEIMEITLHKQYIQDPETFSLFTFGFKLHDGEEITWHEIIRRKWKKGKVVEEEFWVDPSQQVLDLLDNNASKKVMEEETHTEENPETIEETQSQIPITTIKGVGPKSAALFKKEGIEHISQIATIPLEELEDLVAKLNFKSPNLQAAYLKEEAVKHFFL